MKVSCRLVLVALATVGVTGCRGREAASPSGASAGVADLDQDRLTPSQTVRQMSALRTARRYVELRRFIEPERASKVIEFLLAMDELLAANDVVREAVRERLGARPAVGWDLDVLKDRQGLFSPVIRVVDERVEGSDATVTVQVADRVPLETVRLRRLEGRWTYCPMSEVGELPRALRGLSRALRRVALAVKAGPITEEGIRAEFRVRVLPQLKNIELAAGAFDRQPVRGLQ